MFFSALAVAFKPIVAEKKKYAGHVEPRRTFVSGYVHIGLGFDLQFAGKVAVFKIKCGATSKISVFRKIALSALAHLLYTIIVNLSAQSVRVHSFLTCPGCRVLPESCLLGLVRVVQTNNLSAD